MITLNDIVLSDGIQGRVTRTENKKVWVNGREANQIEGCPITEKFLVDNGWSYNVKEDRWIKGDDFNFVILTKYSDEWQVQIEYLDRGFIGWCDYIHELQRAMDACQMPMTLKR